MTGTLARALRARRVDFDRTTFAADAEGTVEGPPGRRGTIRVTKIHITYHLAIPAEHREAAERAVAVHARGCATHATVKDAIAITWSADIAERP